MPVRMSCCICIRFGSFRKKLVSLRVMNNDALTHRRAVKASLSPDAREGSLKVYQDMTLSRWALKAQEQSVYQVPAGRRVWIQVVRGEVEINGQAAGESDALAIWDEETLSIHATQQSEILLFDLPPV